MQGVDKTRRYFQVITNNTVEVMFHTSCSEDILGQTKGSITIVSYTDKKGNTCSVDYPTQQPAQEKQEELKSDYPVSKEEENSEVVEENHVHEPRASCFAAASIVNVSCNAYKDGSISLNITGGKAPYSYVWSNGAVTKDVANLAAGLYSVTITDADKNQCVLHSEIIEECAMNISYELKPVLCYGESNGSIKASVTGGKAPYHFSWNNGAETSNITGLSAGTYKLAVTDANGCLISQTFEIGMPEIMKASVEKNLCTSGKAEVFLEGGKMPYSYFWSNGATTKDVEGLIEGKYFVSVSDANGCTVTENFTISGSTTPISITYTSTKPSCSTNNGGTIELLVAGGVAPYNYFWSNGSTSKNLTDVPAGKYSVTVTDYNGCFETAHVEIQPAAQMEIYTTKFSRISCNGKNDGELEIVVTGGNSPYTYSWSNGATTASLENLSPGEYEVTVTDAIGCTKISKFLIAEPSTINAFIVNEECNDGSIDLSVSGGTRPYNYQWSNGANTEDLTGLEPGYYSVIITDGRGCTAEAEITIFEVVDPITVSLQTTQPKCFEEKGSAQLTVKGGSGIYSYSWSNGNRNSEAYDLLPGSYSVKVSDENGCFKMVNFSIQEPSPLKINTVSVAQISCFGEADGSIELNIAGGAAPYSIKWSNGQNNSRISNLVEGTYSVTVTDVNGCSKSEIYYIEKPEELLANIKVNYCNPLMDLEVSGGSKPYTYLWTDGSSSEDLKSFSEGMYYVEIVDAKGCSIVAGVEVGKPENLNLSFETENSGCKCGSFGSINLTVAGGAGPYTYLWSNGQTTEDIKDLSAGEYLVKVTDVNGCSSEGSVIVEESAPAKIELVKITSSSIGGNEGTIEIKVNGGTSPYSYNWSNGGTSSSLSGLAPGEYVVKVLDATGCETEAAFKVEKSSNTSIPVTAKFENCSDQVICKGETAEITVIYSGSGSWSFTYFDGMKSQNIQTTENPYLLKVSPEVQTTYSLIAINGESSTEDVSGTVTVGVNDCNTSSKSKSCAENCFQSKIIGLKDNGNCVTYTMEVSAGENCRYALSHFSVAMPCGKVSNVTNSRGWKVEIGNTDPTTGITGFKIDDINGFGENGKSGVFTITYTVCKSSECGSSFTSCGPIVAYKAAQCVNYDVAHFEIKAPVAGKISAYPNPSEDRTMTLYLENVKGNEVVLDIKDMGGIQYYNKTLNISDNKAVVLDMLKDFPTGIYLLMITSKDNVYTQRIVLK